MLKFIQSSVFEKWFTRLRDTRAKQRIAVRLDRMASGNAGDAKSVGKGVSELRIDYGPGYRVYFMHRGHLIVVLLCAGTKGTQAADIKRAIEISKEWSD